LVFKVLLHPSAAKDLQKIDEANKARIKKALWELAENPWKPGKSLHPSHFRGIRSGDYRAIYEIDTELKQVTVLFVGHRKKVYDDFSKIF
jgi:mRNA interferase RelE/StbE